VLSASATGSCFGHAGVVVVDTVVDVEVEFVVVDVVWLVVEIFVVVEELLVLEVVVVVMVEFVVVIEVLRHFSAE
jgi:hypothetical protein